MPNTGHPQDGENMQNRTRFLGNTLSLLLFVMIGIQLVLAYVLVSQRAGVGDNLLISILSANWLVWIAVFVCNYALVSCGTVAVRYEHSRIWVNRPEFGFRVLMHVLINWSAAGWTLVAGWAIHGRALSDSLAWLVIAASVAVWIGFNLRHRRMNRARNLTISTGFAAVLMAGSTALLLF